MKQSTQEFVRGWRIVLGSLLGISIGVSSIHFYAIGIFIKPIAAQFGLGRGAASLGALVGTGSAALMAIPIGRVVDRIGSLKVAIVSLVLLAVALACLGAFTSGLESYLVLTAVLALTTVGSTPLPYTRLVVAGFIHSRGLALGLTLAGTGFGAMLVPVFLTPFVARHGWRDGYYALSLVILALLPAVWWLLWEAGRLDRDRQHAVPFLVLTATPTFRVLAAAFFLASTAIFGTLVQFVPMLTDWGLSAREAGFTAGLIGVTAIAARLMVGALLDRAPPLFVTAGVFIVVATGLLILDLGGASFAIGGALLLGVGVGAEVDLIAFLVSRFFIKALYGQTYGAIYACFLIGGALGTAASGYLQQATGDYRASLSGAIGLLLTAAALTVWLDSLNRKVSSQNPRVAHSEQ